MEKVRQLRARLARTGDAYLQSVLRQEINIELARERDHAAMARYAQGLLAEEARILASPEYAALLADERAEYEAMVAARAKKQVP